MKCRFQSFLLYLTFPLFLYSCSSPTFTQRKYFDGWNNDKLISREKTKEKTEVKSLELEVTGYKESDTKTLHNNELVASLSSETILEKTGISFNYLKEAVREENNGKTINIKITPDNFSKPASNSHDAKDFTLMNALELISFLFVFISIVLLLLSNILWLFFAGAALIIFILVQVLW